MTESNFHNNAAQLIVDAAEKSGLLKFVAEVLHFSDNTESPGTCRACALRDALTEAFDEHVCLPHIVLENIYGEGFGFQEGSDEEIAPYLGTVKPRNRAVCPRCEEPFEHDDPSTRDGWCQRCVGEALAAGDLPGWRD